MPPYISINISISGIELELNFTYPVLIRRVLGNSTLWKITARFSYVTIIAKKRPCRCNRVFTRFFISTCAVFEVYRGCRVITQEQRRLDKLIEQRVTFGVAAIVGSAMRYHKVCSIPATCIVICLHRLVCIVAYAKCGPKPISKHQVYGTANGTRA